MDNRDRAWAKISLKNIEHNYKEIKNLVGDKKVLCVIKADAYGHGSLQVAQTLEHLNADYFGVATLKEAISLRQSGVYTPILVLGFFEYKFTQDIIENDITVAVYDYETAENLSIVAKKLGKNIKIHIKIDTGMSRLGFSLYETSETLEIIKKINDLEGILIEGIFSHFAVSDNPLEDNETEKQAQLFDNFINLLEENGIFIEIKHISASGGILRFPKFHYNMVRAGIILYGYYPDKNLEQTINLRPSMTLFARVAQVKEIKAGECISYGRTFTAQSKIKVAVMSIGYADGLLRANSNRAYFMINGKKAPILGRICMDMCMVDVTDIPDVKKDDEAVIFGYFSQDESLGADILAEFSNTIPYEILCAVSKRVPRIYTFD